MEYLFWAALLVAAGLAVRYILRRFGSRLPSEEPTIPAFSPQASRRDVGMAMGPASHERVFDAEGLVFGIRYSDAEGQETRRVVAMKRLWETREDELCLTAYCYLRKAQRNFRVDRILELVDNRTGEVHDGPAAFFADLLEKLSSAPSGHRAVMRRAEPGLKVLVWISHADRKLDAAEIEEMLAFIEARARAVRGDSAWDPELARTWLQSVRFTKDDAKRAIRRMGIAERELARSAAERLSAFSDGNNRRYVQLARLL